MSDLSSKVHMSSALTRVHKIGVVAIVIDDTDSVEQVNSILHQHAGLIVGRMGIPYRQCGVSVISLIVDGGPDELSAMTGLLGRLPGISVKAAYTKKQLAAINRVIAIN